VIRLALVGAWGRMGRAVEAAAAESGDVTVALRVGEDGRCEIVEPGRGPAGYPPEPGGDALPALLRAGDVVVDFSQPEGLRRAAAACGAAGVPLVTGTTGLGPEEEAALARAAARVAVLHAANFSLGVLALRRVLAAALDTVPGDWDIEIVERHHRRKADSPSGTALALARDAAARRGLDDGAFRHGRSGRVGPRPAAEIGLHAVRGGTWVGEHSVLLAGAGESIELRHVAEDRSAFAHGAIAAARFVAAAPAGRYALEDVLGAPGRAR
jgi:4-hydroxy-tetrahydrodipicolinate reductase